MRLRSPLWRLGLVLLLPCVLFGLVDGVRTWLGREPRPVAADGEPDVDSVGYVVFAYGMMLFFLLMASMGRGRRAEPEPVQDTSSLEEPGALEASR